VNCARWDLCGGCRATGIPTAILGQERPQGIAPGSGHPTPAGSSGFNNAKLNAIPPMLSDHVLLGGADVPSASISARSSAASGRRSGTARLWYNDPFIATQSA
jgi:hypothetical protein